MTDESLNIEWHTKRLCLKALNTTISHDDAAIALGITGRTLYRYKRQFNIGFDKKENRFYFKGEPAILIKQTTEHQSK